MNTAQTELHDAREEVLSEAIELLTEALHVADRLHQELLLLQCNASIYGLAPTPGVCKALHDWNAIMKKVA
jgi:hypothetical protein